MIPNTLIVSSVRCVVEISLPVLLTDSYMITVRKDGRACLIWSLDQETDRGEPLLARFDPSALAHFELALRLAGVGQITLQEVLRTLVEHSAQRRRDQCRLRRIAQNWDLLPYEWCR